MKHINKYLLQFTGIAIILGYVYMRFVRERTKSDLYFIKITEDVIIIEFYLLIICLLFLITSALGLYFSIKQILHSPINIPNNRITYYLAKFIIIMKKSLQALEEAIGSKMEDSYEKVRDLILSFYKNYGFKIKQMFLLFYGIPYFLVSVVFVFEVFIRFKLSLFYNILPVLTIPLIFAFWIYLIDKLVLNLTYIRDKFIIAHEIMIDGKDQITLAIKPDTEITDYEFIQYNNEYLLLYPLEGFLHSYHTFSDYYKPYLLFIINMCFFTGWFYILIFNIYYFF